MSEEHGPAYADDKYEARIQELGPDSSREKIRAATVEMAFYWQWFSERQPEKLCGQVPDRGCINILEMSSGMDCEQDVFRSGWRKLCLEGRVQSILEGKEDGGRVICTGNKRCAPYEIR